MKRESASAYRNEKPISEVLDRLLDGRSSTMLEIASGTGQHAAAFARAFAHVSWHPTDPDEAALASISAWKADARLPNLQAPQRLDVISGTWQAGDAMAGIPDRPDGIYCANMIHIAPWAAAEGLIAGAGARLAEDGFLLLYGPYRRGGAHTSEGNRTFDASLRAQDPSWGIRDLEAVEALAHTNGLALGELIEMPANNLSLIFRRRVS